MPQNVRSISISPIGDPCHKGAVMPKFEHEQFSHNIYTAYLGVNPKVRAPKVFIIIHFCIGKL